MKQTALVSFLWPKHVSVLERYLAKRPRVVLSPKGAVTEELRRIVSAHGGALVALEDLFGPDELRTLMQQAAALRRHASQIITGQRWASFAETMRWDVARVRPLITDALLPCVQRGMIVVEALEKAWREYFIELVVVNEDWTAAPRSAVAWAKARGIPSLQLCHAMALAKAYTVHSTVLSDIVAVFGKRGAESLLDAGVAEARIRVTGNPAWDLYPVLRARREQISADLCAKYGLNRAWPLVVFGTTWDAKLTAISDADVYRRTLRAFLSACRALLENGVSVNLLVKDRPANAAFGRETVARIADEVGLSRERFVYTTADTEALVVSADIVISVDSNLSTEAMLAGVPAVNLVDGSGLRLGPSFDAESGILHVEPAELAMAVRLLLDDASLRKSLVEAMRVKAEYYNLGQDGRATERVAILMTETALKRDDRERSDQAKDYVWEELAHGGAAQLKPEYGPAPRSELVGMFVHSPRLVLEIGCATGTTGAFIKETYPDAFVLGIELNQAAAKIAAARLDKVIARPIEQIDFAAEGIARHSIDTLIVADVLEHMVDPWSAMIRLKPYLTSDAQILASIPNIRNLWVINELVSGRWRYEKAGLLDITHLRFFTLEEIIRFFSETGFKVLKIAGLSDARCMGIQAKDGHLNVETDKFILKNMSANELRELQTLQFLVVAAPLEPAAPTNATESVRLADQQIAAGDLTGAQRALTRALELTPEIPELIVALGNVLLRVGDVEGSRREFVKATVLRPDYAPAHADLAAVLLYLERGAEAEASARRALELDSTNISALKILAKVCLDTERYQEAVQAYATILALAPDDIETLILVGNCYAETGRFEQARSFYQMVLALDPRNTIATENLAVVSGKTPSSEQIDLIGREISERKSAQVSIIIPVFNRLDLTRQCLEAVRHNTPAGQYELIVVDNGSSDGTTEFLRREQDAGRLRAILNRENGGFARACNQGALTAAGTDLLFLNNDTEVQSGWFDPLVTVLETDPAVGAVGSKLLFPNGAIQHAGVILIEQQEGQERLIARHIDYRETADQSQVNQSMTFQALTAACLLIRRSVFEQVHGFEEDYWNGYEDVDLCLKMQEFGWLLVYEPRSVVIHYESQSGDQRFRKIRDNVERLNRKWTGRVVADVVVRPDGSCENSGANRVRPYRSPSSLTSDSAPEDRMPPEPVIADTVAEVSQHIEAHLQNGDLNAARHALTKAIGLAPDHRDLIVALGHVAWKQGDLEEADRQFARATALASDHVPAYVALGALRLQQGQLAHAEEAARKALALDATAVAALKIVAKICLDTERYQEAVQAYTTILQHAPNDIETLTLVGNCYAETGRFEQARVFYRKALGLDPGNQIATDNLAEVDRLAAVAPAKVETGTSNGAGSDGCRSVSIVVVTYNSATTVRACLDSVLGESRPVTELIVVDNASMDETRAILDTYHDRATVILNANNVGFSAACNQGIRASSGDYVVLLNPDTVVTPKWLERLIFHLGPDVGAVGPVSDYAAGLQNLKRNLPDGVPKSMGLGEVSDLLSRVNRGKRVETKLLIGFCLMLPRRVLNEVGLLDEELFLGNDDLDLSWRLRLKGHKLLVAADTFVHHEGQVSFKSERSAKASRLVQESTDRLYAKLETYYGLGNVPSPMELWGITWFKPTETRETQDLNPEAPLTPHPLPFTSIIVLTHNGLEHTKECLTSIETHTPEPHELIIVDNASTDGTLDYLRDYMVAHDNIRVVANRTNRGFAAGNNQGLALAGGAYVLLLNNDTIVTEGWLRRMLAVFKAHPGVGIVGPMSNRVSGPQLVRDASYKGPEALEAFAVEWTRRHDGQSSEAARIVGFCLLARKEVVARIGGLDEQFGSGNFEDDDFCIRAFQVGFRSRIALDVFIHHTGSQTFKVAKIDYRQSLMRNWELFKHKWGIPADAPYEKGYRFPPQSASDSPQPIPLPDVNADHQCDGDGRWWPESPGDPVQPFDKDRDPSRPAVTEDARLNIIVVPNGHGLAPLWPSLVKHTNHPLAITISPSNRNGNSADLAHEGVCPKGWQVKTGKLPSIRVLNQLIQSADDNPVILLSGNLIMTPGWLKRLLAALKCDQGLAAVGPTSNRGVALQQIKSDYKGIGKALRQFALRRAHRYKQQLAVTGNLAGSCIVFNPAVCRSIGPLREDTDLTVSLTDYFARIKQAGHTVAVALDAYVHCE